MSDYQNFSVPENWTTAKLEEVAAVLDNFREPVNSKERQKRIEGKSQETLFPYYGATGQVGFIDDYLLEGEHVLLGEDGAPFLDFVKDTAYLVRGKFWVNNHAHILQSLTSNKYLCHFLNQVDYRNYVTGTTRLKLNQSAMRQIPVKIPPIAEQQRIVDKIEELFSDLDSGINSLKTAQQQLKVYRQAVLKWAFEGKLTAQWREEQQRQGKLASADTLLAQIKAERDRRYQKELEAWQSEVEAWEAIGKEGKKPRKPRKFNEPKLSVEDLEELPNLPKGWQWVFPENICSPEDYSLAIGPFGSNLKVKDYRDSGKPLVFVRHITSGNFDLNSKYVSEEKFKELKPHAIQPLDLLVTKMGDPPGDCEIYPIGRESAIITADCLKFRVWSDYVSRKFYKYCINSNLIKKQLGLITQGVAQKKISLERFKSLRFPLPTTTEQEQIVEEIESRLSICDQLEADIEANLKKAEALCQSILKQAFEGKLVPQDPNDEPAEVLLERIRGEHKAEKNNGKGKTRADGKKRKPQSDKQISLNLST